MCIIKNIRELKNQCLFKSVQFYVCRDGSRADATSKMERLVIIVNGWKLLVLDPSVAWRI